MALLINGRMLLEGGQIRTTKARRLPHWLKEGRGKGSQANVCRRPSCASLSAVIPLQTPTPPRIPPAMIAVNKTGHRHSQW